MATQNAVDRAESAVKAYITANEGMEHEPLHSVLSDLLADLMHWADTVELDPDRPDIDFEFLAERARGNYLAERVGTELAERVAVAIAARDAATTGHPEWPAVQRKLRERES